MDNIATHMRISGVTVSDEDVNSRRSATVSLASNWGKEKNALAIILKAADIAIALGGDGNPTSSLGSEVQKVIQKKSSSFLYQERPLDVSVCAGMAVVFMLIGKPSDGGWTTPDVYANALWSALAYQPALEAERREKLRQEVLRVAVNWAQTSSENARQRKDVPDPAAVKATIDANNTVTTTFSEATAPTFEALRRNAALDREELDFLWWAQLSRSRLLNKQLSAINEPTRIVTAGIEGARLLRRLPCQVHREIVLRTLDADPALDLTEMLVAVGDNRTSLAAEFTTGNVIACPTVFPLLHAIATGEVGASPGAAEKRPVSEWGERALLEAGFYRMAFKGPGKL